MLYHHAFEKHGVIAQKRGVIARKHRVIALKHGVKALLNSNNSSFENVFTF